MPPDSRPVKLACLTCRAAKIRCDGQKPCSNCASHQEECRYQPSRRGGARKGHRVAEQLKKRGLQTLAPHIDINGPPQGHSHTSADVSFPSTSTIEPGHQTPDVALENSNGEPSSPIEPFHDAPELLDPVESPTRSIRAYRCDEDLINAYYIFIHPYFPALPPPAVPQYEDRYERLDIRSSATSSNLPYFPASPLGLAVAAILALIPPPGEAHTGGNQAITLRRSLAELFARPALDSLEDGLGISSRVDWVNGPRSTLHSEVPQIIEPVLALGLLSVYEYCQNGNIPKMRVRANQALTTAMDLSLHTEDPQMGGSDAHRRCWWSTVLLVYQSSILNASAPVITFDDPRITTHFPEFRGCREPWPLLANAQSALLRSCYIGRQLINESNNTTGLSPPMFQEIQSLDSYIMELAAEADRFRCVTNYQSAEADASRSQWAISNALIHTSRLTLHRVLAFMDHLIFSDKHCDLLAIDALHFSQQTHQFRLSTGRRSEINALFPFTQQESVRICLNSALVVSRVFRRLACPNPMYSDTSDVEIPKLWSFRGPFTSPRSIPLMACLQMQSFCVLAVVLWQVRTAMLSGNFGSYSHLLDRPSVTTDIQDTERLMEELQLGMETLGKSLHADAVFEGMGRMVREVERLNESTMID